ncbi:hypothetical protein [Nocardia wallacei]|uniref:Uncharacterized protein n=1 Tax=Nocardia wallacei TaxID=480035 RepID=A0A7G1KXE1_9NOCA|nr:hypothetical protein [Nocardia wallacei]BCK59286.1 hypothetical protein NWFMUON74_70580 [Nocardia wallacei]
MPPSVLLGRGLRLFGDTDAEATLAPSESQVLGNGVILATYRVERASRRFHSLRSWTSTPVCCGISPPWPRRVT